MNGMQDKSLSSEQSRTFTFPGAVTAGSLGRVIAEARDSGVPEDAAVTITSAPEGSFLASMKKLAGQPPGSTVTFTWKG
jgi:hypothetical protein